MSWRCLLPSSWEDVFKTSSRRLIKTNIFALALGLQKTPSRRLQDVLVKTNIFVLAICLQDVFKTFSRRLQDIFKTFWRRLQDVFKTSSRPLQGVFKTSSRRLDQDEYVCLSLTSSEDVFKTSWSRPIYSSWPYVFKTSSRHLQDVLQRYLQDVFKTYHQVKLFWEISQNTQEDICAWISFLDKVKLCRSAASLKTRL